MVIKIKIINYINYNQYVIKYPYYIFILLIFYYYIKLIFNFYINIKNVYNDYVYILLYIFHPFLFKMILIDKIIFYIFYIILIISLLLYLNIQILKFNNYLIIYYLLY